MLLVTTSDVSFAGERIRTGRIRLESSIFGSCIRRIESGRSLCSVSACVALFLSPCIYIYSVFKMLFCRTIISFSFV